MRILLIALPAALLFPLTAFAGSNVGGCGLGSKLFAGQAGIAPQVLAVTTNGSSGSQTFGISTGTSGCSQDGIVKTNWRTAMFIDANTTKLAYDISQGEGETLESLASLIGVEDNDKELFFRTSQQNFSRIFPSAETSSTEVRVSLQQVLLESSVLSQYASAI